MATTQSGEILKEKFNSDDDRRNKLSIELSELSRNIGSRRRNRFYGSCFEIFVAIMFVFYNIAEWRGSYPVNFQPEWWMFIFTQNFLFAAAFVIAEIFSFILFEATLLVGPLMNLAERRKNLSPAQGIDAKTQNLVQAILAPEAQTGVVAPDDDISRAMKDVIKRSIQAYKSAQLRPNVLLFAGTIISVIGLLFFILTLPQIGSSFYSDATQSLTTRILEIAPRFLMLVFIQVLAGFFLRQYRSSMEELRYYESILRYREDQLSSYLIRRAAKDKSLVEFASIIIERRDFLSMKSGDTTSIIEAQRSELNEFKGIFESFIETIRGVVPKANDKPG